jgi:hypothetical protein
VKTHGESCRGQWTPEYRTWLHMRNRCLNEKDPNYKYHGGRGITIDPRWDRYENFLEDMGRRPSPKHSIERKKNELGYSKENCEWAVHLTQCNNRRSNKPLTYNGRTQTRSEWAREMHMKPATLGYRIKAGWSVERALLTPVLPCQ